MTGSHAQREPEQESERESASATVTWPLVVLLLLFDSESVLRLTHRFHPPLIFRIPKLLREGVSSNSQRAA